MASTSPAGASSNVRRSVEVIPQPPTTATRLVVERADQGRHEVAGRLEAGVEQDDHRRLDPADPDVRRRRVAQPLRRPHDLDGEVAALRCPTRSTPAPPPAPRTGRRRRPPPMSRPAHGHASPRARARGPPASRWRPARPWRDRPPDPRSAPERCARRRTGPGRPRRHRAARRATARSRCRDRRWSSRPPRSRRAAGRRGPSRAPRGRALDRARP